MRKKKWWSTIGHIMVSTTRRYYLLFPSEHWSPKKPPKISFYCRFLFCIPEQVCCNTSQYLLRVQLLISQTFPMALPARLCRHQTPEGRRRWCGAASKLQLRTDSAPSRAQPPWQAQRTVPQATFPKAVGSRGKADTDSWLTWAPFP